MMALSYLDSNISLYHMFYASPDITPLYTMGSRINTPRTNTSGKILPDIYPRTNTPGKISPDNNPRVKYLPDIYPPSKNTLQIILTMQYVYNMYRNIKIHFLTNAL